MARPASELTLAIWGLCESNPDITHAQAQVLLKQQGFEVVAKPEMSDDLKSWREQGKALNIADKGDYINCRIENEEYVYDKDAFDKLVTATGLSKARGQKVLQEIMLRTAFDAEANNFNVVKYNWRKRSNDRKPTASRKPTVRPKRTAAKTTTVVTNGAPRPKHAPKTRSKTATPAKPVVVATGGFTPTTALEYVNGNGGLTKVKGRVSEIDSEVKALEAKLAELRAEQEQHTNAMNVLADFQKAVREAA